MAHSSIYFQLWWCSTSDPKPVLTAIGGGNCLCSDRS